MGRLIENIFPQEIDEENEAPALYETPKNISRDERINNVAQAAANIFHSALYGIYDDMLELAEFLEDSFRDFEPPLTSIEQEFLYRRSVRAIKELEKK